MLASGRNNFWFTTLLIVVVTIVVTLSLRKNAKLDILPIIIQTKYDKPPRRTPGTFKEDHGPYASLSELIFNGDSTFTFHYKKSEKKDHAFAGLFFPLENLNINFSKYHAITIGIDANLARRIPLNLSVQNKIFTHQYVRHFIELKSGTHDYQLPLKEFFTPSSWYAANQISQAEIPKQDFSKIEALSMESCHLLAKGIEDYFTVTHITLEKNYLWAYIGTIVLAILAIILARFKFLHSSPSEVKIAPEASSETFSTKTVYPSRLIEKVLIAISQRFTKNEFSINDLTKEFDKTEEDIQQIIKQKTPKKNFIEYVDLLRIEEAKRILIEKPAETISEVGFAVGFKNSRNFLRVFKSQVGVSPKSYAELHKK